MIKYLSKVKLYFSVYLCFDSICYFFVLSDKEPSKGKIMKEAMKLAKTKGEKLFGSGALSGKMLLVRIIENDKINVNFRSGWVN